MTPPPPPSPYSEVEYFKYGMCCEDNCRCIEPWDVKRAIGGFQERFTGFAQHDAQELLNFLVDGLHEDLNAVTERKWVSQHRPFSALS
jgi:ubiquitin C-terminal hydrolase